jgi:pimeloyl-ACP methyl ester carboxylesterase
MTIGTEAVEASERLVHIGAGPVGLEGSLLIPPGAAGIVVFAHGSGSSRHSPRNRFVAAALRQERLGTLLLHLRFDIELLADRLVAATDFLARQPSTRDLPIGYFGASTGAGAALVAAAQRPDRIAAVVSRGGRPDLAGGALPRVEAPTLLIVGGDDLPVIELNREAMAQMRCKRRLEIVPGASHLFEEPGALEGVARLARTWFAQHLVPKGASRVGSRTTA